MGNRKFAVVLFAALVVVATPAFVARTAAQAAPTVSLRALEVNQETQDWHNSVSLVANKPTGVRAFLEVPAGTAATPFAGQLAGTSGGNPLPGSPLNALNPGGSVNVSPDIVSRRANLADSLNFELPIEWRAAGTITLTLTAPPDGPALTCANPAGSGASTGAANSCSVTVTFTAGKVPSIKFIKVPFKDANGVIQTPTDAQVTEQMERVKSVFPTADVTYSIDSIAPFDTPINIDTNGDEIFKRLAAKRQADFGQCGTACPAPSTRYYGLIAGDCPTNPCTDGIGETPGVTGFSFIGSSPDRNSVDNRYTALHELGHNYGEQHPVDPSFGTNAKGELKGPCGETASQGTPAFPFYETVPIDTNNPPTTAKRPALGPLSQGPDNEAWGLDNRYLKDNTNNLAVVDPRKTYELMSYCNDWHQPQNNWPSTKTVADLLPNLDAALDPPESGTAASGHVTQQPSGEYLSVAGSIDLGANTATLDAVSRIAGAPELPTPGAYRVSLRDGGGAELAGADFTPIVIHGDPKQPDTAAPPEMGTFVVALAKPATPVAEVAVLHNGTVIGSEAGSTQAPTVSITSPTPGQKFSDHTVTFSWTATGPSGATLTYDVFYSADGGASWDTIAVDETDTTLSMDRAELKASPSALLRVDASDGVTVATTTSQPFSVAPSAPDVFIDDPVDGDTFATDEAIDLSGTAVDAQGSALPDASFSWTSSSGGVLGTGRALTVPPGRLAPGHHVLKLTVTDPDGRTADDTVRVDIVPAPIVTTTTTSTSTTTSSTTTTVPGTRCQRLADREASIEQALHSSPPPGPRRARALSHELVVVQHEERRAHCGIGSTSAPAPSRPVFGGSELPPSPVATPVSMPVAGFFMFVLPPL